MLLILFSEQKIQKQMVLQENRRLQWRGKGPLVPRSPAPFTYSPPSLTVSKVKGRTSCEMNPTLLSERHFLFGCGLARTFKKKQNKTQKTASQSVPHFIQRCWINAINNINNWNKGFFRRRKAICRPRWDTPAPLTGGSPAHTPTCCRPLLVVCCTECRLVIFRAVNLVVQ